MEYGFYNPETDSFANQKFVIKRFERPTDFFTMISNVAIDFAIRKLSGTELSIWLYLRTQYSENTGQKEKFNTAYIAEVCGCSCSTIKRAVRKLTDLGYLRLEQGRTYGFYEYSFEDEELINNGGVKPEDWSKNDLEIINETEKVEWVKNDLELKNYNSISSINNEKNGSNLNYNKYIISSSNLNQTPEVDKPINAAAGSKMTYPSSNLTQQPADQFKNDLASFKFDPVTDDDGSKMTYPSSNLTYPSSNLTQPADTWVKNDLASFKFDPVTDDDGSKMTYPSSNLTQPADTWVKNDLAIDGAADYESLLAEVRHDRTLKWLGDDNERFDFCLRNLRERGTEAQSAWEFLKDYYDNGGSLEWIM